MNILDFTEINNLIIKCKIYIERGQIKVVNINGCNLMVFENGDIYRWMKGGKIKLVQNTDSCGGYNCIGCNGKFKSRHRIIAYAFLGLDMNNTKLQIDHIDRNRLNNNLCNLRIVNNQQNSFNSTSKGYYFDKCCK